MDKRIGTAEELAERLTLKPKTIRDWARQGVIPSLRISPKVIRFDFDEVEKALRQRALRSKKGNERCTA